MNALQLHLPGGMPAKAFACDACGRVWPDREFADKCCVCSYCGKHVEAGKVYHVECWRAEIARQTAETLASAELLPSWDGWVYCDNKGYNNGFFENLDELTDYLSGTVSESEWPERVHVCKAVPFPGVDLDSVIENLTEEMFDDAAEQLKGVDELDAAIRKFNEANKGLISYYPDYKRAVAVPKLAAEQAGEEGK